MAPDPRTLPLVKAADVSHAGSFTVPRGSGDASLDYGGWGLGLGADGKSLYFGGHDHHDRLARVSIPSVGGAAQLLNPAVAVPGKVSTENREKIGGTLPWGGKLLINKYAYYDASHSAFATTIVADQTLTNFKPPVRIGAHGYEGHIAGPMTVVPTEWRALLGGPALTGLAGVSIASRTSLGPSVWVFNPDDVLAGRAADATALVDYPLGHPLADDDGPANDFYIQSDVFWGIAFPAGTRSVLVIGVHGMGRYCYGGGDACGDPMNRNQGTHAFPYRYQVWAYDANELLKVKAGTLKSWEVQPYAVWQLKGLQDTGWASMTGATFDPATRRIYLTERYGETPKVHVWQVTIGTSPDPDPVPVPVHCAGAWGPWVTTETGPCTGTPPTQTLTQRSTFAITRPSAHGGNPCEAIDGQVRTRQVVQPCTPAPEPEVRMAGRIVAIGQYPGSPFLLVTVTLDTGGTYHIVTGSVLGRVVGDRLDMVLPPKQ